MKEEADHNNEQFKTTNMCGGQDMKTCGITDDNLVVFLDCMGSDDSVCDAARVSMNKTADLFTVNQNERLINYLAKHNHWSPFSHVFIKMRFKAPIFIARQLAKHQIGFSWNEVSRRYVSSTPEFWKPTGLRLKAENIKQGSSEDISKSSNAFIDIMTMNAERDLALYNAMLEDGVCPEQARMVLPQSMMTEWIWTGSLYAWSRMYKLRSDSHAQREVQIYAYHVSNICRKHFPLSWNALCE